MTDHNGYEHEEDADGSVVFGEVDHERYVRPEAMTPGELAMVDQYAAKASTWADDAVAYLVTHATEVHAGDVTSCPAYCADGTLFVNLDSLDADRLRMMVLVMLHERMRRDYATYVKTEETPAP